jgi:tRNA(Ile)-lysidine synthetase-like protein
MDSQAILAVKSFWYEKSNEQYWFKQKDEFDEIVVNTFGTLFNNTNLPNIEEIIKCVDDREILYEILLGTVILYDQVHRNFIRYNKTEKIKKFDSIALMITNYIIEHDLLLEYEPKEVIFILLPLRHTFEIENIMLSIKIITKLRNEDNNAYYNNSYYQRFYKASIRSVAKINNENSLEPMTYNWYEGDDDIIYNVLDSNSSKNIFEIHELNKNKITKVFVNAFKKILKELKQHDYTQIIISLSGGVDSMVSAFILQKLCIQNNIGLIAFMINYNNRETSEAEVLFVSRYARLLKIPIYVKEINEIKRDQRNDREFYEQITKEIRFSMYELLSYMNGNKSAIVLGHNKDDTEENILVNIHKLDKLSNLKGMTTILTKTFPSNEKETTIVRPMLDISKNEIYQFATEYMVPYLYDSTPIWSTRWKMRNELIPEINRVKDTLLPDLLQMSDHLTEMYELYEKTVLSNIISRLYSNKNDIGNITDIIFDMTEGFKFNNIVSKDIIYHVCNEFKIGTVPSNNTIKYFTETIQQLMQKNKEHNNKRKDSYIRLISDADAYDSVDVCYLPHINKIIFIKGYQYRPMSVYRGNTCMNIYRKDAFWKEWKPT